MVTRLPLDEFKMSKNDKQTYKRFLNFMKGEYSIEKGKPQEEQKKQVQVINEGLAHKTATRISWSLDSTKK